MTLHTEAEARQKWCPLAGNSSLEAGGNRCIASACMMWTWGEWENLPGEPRAGFFNVPSADLTKPLRGFCGLAGKP